MGLQKVCAIFWKYLFVVGLFVTTSTVIYVFEYRKVVKKRPLPFYCDVFSEYDSDRFDRLGGLLLNVPLVPIYAWLCRSIINKWILFFALLISFETRVTNIDIWLDEENHNRIAVNLFYMVLEIFSWYGIYKFKPGKYVDIIEKSCKAIQTFWISNFVALFLIILENVVSFGYVVASRSNCDVQSDTFWITRVILDFGYLWIVFFIVFMGCVLCCDGFNITKYGETAQKFKASALVVRSQWATISVASFFMTLVAEFYLIYNYLDSYDKIESLQNTVYCTNGMKLLETYQHFVIYPIHILATSFLFLAVINNTGGWSAWKDFFKIVIKAKFFEFLTLVVITSSCIYTLYNIFYSPIVFMHMKSGETHEMKQIDIGSKDMYRIVLDRWSNFYSFLINYPMVFVMMPSLMTQIMTTLNKN